MKKGDIVTIVDGSYSMSIISGKLVHEVLDDRYGVKSEQYVIIETGCSFPNTGDFDSFNNIVIQAIDSGKIVFTEERFLQLVLPTHKVMVNIDCIGGIITGNFVEVSDELYKKNQRWPGVKCSRG